MAKTTTTKRKTTTKKKAETNKTWKIGMIPVAGGELFSAYKLKDESKPDEASNRAYQGGFWNTEKEAQNVADRYNEENK